MLRQGGDAHVALLSTGIIVNAEQLFLKSSLLALLCTGKDMAHHGTEAEEGL